MRLPSRSTLLTWLPKLIPLFIMVVIAAVYGQVVHFEFLSWDDYQLLTASPLYNPPTAQQISKIWQAPQYQLYIPVTYSLWAVLAYFWWQPEAGPIFLYKPLHFPPYPFHAVNLLLHIANAWLVFAILRHVLARNITPEGSKEKALRIEGGALVGTLFFALHPLQAEPVAWVSELKGMLSSFFVLCALWQFLRFLTVRSRPNPALWFQRWLFYSALFFYILAFLAKPAALPAPLMALILGKFASSYSWRDLARQLWPWWAFAAIAVYIARWAQPGQALLYPVWWRPFVAGDALAFYMGKTLWPVDLACNYARTPPVVMEHWWAYGMWVFPVLLAIAAVLSRSQSLKTAYWLWLTPLLPVLGLTPFVHQLLSTVADRYAYLSLLGPALLLAWLVSQRKAVVIGSCLLGYIVFLAVLSHRQTGVWSNSRALFSHCLQTVPRSWIAKENLAVLASIEGRKSEAITYYLQALSEPNLHPMKINDYGIALGDLGDYVNSEICFLRAVRIDPSYGRAWSNLGTVYASTERWAEALNAYQQAARWLPEAPEVHMNLGLLWARERQLDEAIASYQRALQLEPGNVETIYNLGLAHANKKDYVAAQGAFLRAIELNPQHWPARHALGMTFHLQGQQSKAEQIWQALLKENPQFEPTRQILQTLKSKAAPLTSKNKSN